MGGSPINKYTSNIFLIKGRFLLNKRYQNFIILMKRDTKRILLGVIYKLTLQFRKSETKIKKYMVDQIRTLLIYICAIFFMTSELLW